MPTRMLSHEEWSYAVQMTSSLYSILPNDMFINVVVIRGEKKMKLDDLETSEVISSKLQVLSLKIMEMNQLWDQQTKGLHLGPDGQLLGPDGHPVSWDRRRSARTATETVTVEKTVTTTLTGAAPPAAGDEDWRAIEKRLREVR